VFLLTSRSTRRRRRGYGRSFTGTSMNISHCARSPAV
jgi:hypothetical protein